MDKSTLPRLSPMEQPKTILKYNPISPNITPWNLPIRSARRSSRTINPGELPPLAPTTARRSAASITTPISNLEDPSSQLSARLERIRPVLQSLSRATPDSFVPISNSNDTPLSEEDTEPPAIVTPIMTDDSVFRPKPRFQLREPISLMTSATSSTEEIKPRRLLPGMPILPRRLETIERREPSISPIDPTGATLATNYRGKLGE